MFCAKLMPPLQKKYLSCQYEVQSLEDRHDGKMAISQSFVHLGADHFVSRTFANSINDTDSPPEFLDGQSLPTSGQRLTIITNPEYFAMIGIDSEQKFLLRQISTVDRVNAPGNESVVYACPLPQARLPYLTIAENPDSVIESFTETEWKGRKALQLLAAFSVERFKSMGPLKCESYFDPTLGICLAATVSIGDGLATSSFEIEYDQNTPPDTLPALSRIIAVTVEGDKNVKSTTTFRNWKFADPAPNVECYLSYYGLPEPPDPNAKSSTAIPAWLWAFGTGIGLLIASMVVRRSRRSSP